MSETKELLMHYDSMMPDIVDKINELLAPYGLAFVDDNEEHDGYIRYSFVVLTDQTGKDAS